MLKKRQTMIEGSLLDSQNSARPNPLNCRIPPCPWINHMGNLKQDRLMLHDFVITRRIHKARSHTIISLFRRDFLRKFQTSRHSFVHPTDFGETSIRPSRLQTLNPEWYFPSYFPLSQYSYNPNKLFYHVSLQLSN